MAFADLREFIAHLEKHGQLRRITVPVSRDLEISEITDRVSKSSGTRNVALLFENVQGFSVPCPDQCVRRSRAHGGRSASSA
jgi:4-hydroxy-3-polyprenylbenzoate decarboxylase